MFHSDVRPLVATEPGAGGVGIQSLLRSLQHENEALRDELLRTKQERDHARQQLGRVNWQQSAAAFAKSSAAAQRRAHDASQIAALRARCEQLANRLVACVRNQQLSQSSEVLFLLRMQQEERRYVCVALVEMLESLNDFGGTGSFTCSPLPSEGEIPAGATCRLVEQLADALQARTALHKLAKAWSRIPLERASAIVREMQEIIAEATRAVYSSWSILTASPMYSTEPTPLRWSSGSPYKQAETSRVEASKLTNPSVMEDMSWACDVLKACYRGLADVQTLHDTALKELSLHVSDILGADTPRAAMGPRTEGTKALLDSVLADVQAVTARSSRFQERLTRRLTMELQRHYEAAKHFEERIQQLDSENSRLLTTAAVPVAAPPHSAGAPRQNDTKVSRALALHNSSGELEPDGLPPSATPVITPERHVRPLPVNAGDSYGFDALDGSLSHDTPEASLVVMTPPHPSNAKSFFNGSPHSRGCDQSLRIRRPQPRPAATAATTPLVGAPREQTALYERSVTPPRRLHTSPGSELRSPATPEVLEPAPEPWHLMRAGRHGVLYSPSTY